uniref:Uncharacterized protein n=1 Tax=Salmonella typhimurium TaxID=90371 RepID=A0A0D3RM40_SALTM|nr:hypothetical protein [Salmonella enterica subsp. enterica serovar Typhimurium]
MLSAVEIEHTQSIPTYYPVVTNLTDRITSMFVFTNILSLMIYAFVSANVTICMYLV